MSKRTLLVWPNPFHALDHEGRPAGVLPYEPEGNGTTTFDDRRFVGAQLKSEITQRFPRGDARQSIQRTWFEFTDVAIRVKNTAYYSQAIARGEIFAADEESAKLCGIDKSFLEPGSLLERAREEAAGFWKQQAHEHHDEDVPELLSKFAFGPMPEALAALKKADEEGKKAAAEAEKKAAAEADAAKADAKKKADKVESDKQAAARAARGGE